MVSFWRQLKRNLHLGPFIVTLRYAFRRTFTRVFPYEDAIRADAFRGLLALDMKKCVGCKACERVCPNKTIKMVTMENKDRYPGYFSGRCMFCGLCVEACNYDALIHSTEFEHVGFSRNDLYFSPFRMNEVFDKYVKGKEAEFMSA